MTNASPPQRILVIRLSAIGDVIIASGLIPALRQLYPEAHIAWLTEETNAELLRHNPRLDRLYLWPRRRWRELRREGHYRQFVGEALDLIHRLRAERFDLVLDLQGLLKSGLWTWLSGGKRRIGLGSREGSQWLMTETLDRRAEDNLIGKEYRKLAALLGASTFQMDIAVSPDDEQSAAELLRTAGVVGEFAVISPFTTRPQKHWLDERWTELSQWLSAERGLTVVMLGGPGDREHAALIAQGTAIHDLTGRTTLGQCAALIKNARLLVGVDTGLTHLGIALGTPTLALFGSTRPYLETESRTAQVLYERLDCSPCRRRPTCGGVYHCMKAHTTEKVFHAATSLLEHAR